MVGIIDSFANRHPRGPTQLLILIAVLLIIGLIIIVVTGFLFAFPL
jgi:hypothetical protein